MAAMAIAIPTEQPLILRQGDTLAFTQSFHDFPADSGWTLTYVFSPLGGGQPITFSSTNSGGLHLLSVDAATTLTWPAGEYTGQAYVAKLTERYSVECKPIEIFPDLTTAAQADPRTRARKILDFIVGSHEKIVQKQAVNAVIDGLQIQFRTFDEWIKIHDHWSGIVAREEAVASGKPGRAILARFTCPL